MSEKIVQLNEEIIKGQIKELVRGSVEETLNELLEKEAESLTQAARYHQRAEQESLRSHRGLAEPLLAGRALSIRLRGRHLPAPQLERRV